MASQTRSIHLRKDRQEHRPGVNRFDCEGAAHQVPSPSEYCAVCFLTFGSQERRVFWGEKVAHPSCASRLRRSDAA